MKNKTAIVLLTTLLMLSLLISIRPALGDAAIAKGSQLPTYSFINIYPNPVGVGQQVTLGIFLANPFPTNEVATNMTIVETTPSGNTITLGPYTSDLTAGTVAYMTPDTIGNYTFQLVYLGQALTNSTTYNSLTALPSKSPVATLVVQQEPVVQRNYPYTPLPTQWWQTPVSAENVQNWYAITGAWLGLASNSFATTGSYNASSYFNPYTESVNAGHVLWTKPWLAGGVAGGIFGGDEVMGHYWSTFQYTPRYAPVIMDGVIYSTHYTTGMSTGEEEGIDALNLYTGQTMWTINTTNTLRCGMEFNQYTINDYGVRGPWIWTTGTLPACDTGGNYIAPPGASSPYMNTTGTQWNLYDGVSGKYEMSIVNGSALTIGQDSNGDLIGYFLNNTAGKQIIYPTSTTGGVASGASVSTAISTTTGPHITAVNMTAAAGFTSYISPENIAVNTVRNMSTGYIWDKMVPTNISGVTIDPALALSSITGNALVLTSGSTNAGTHGYEIWASMDATTGAQLQAVNVTYPGTAAMLPYTRTIACYGDGLIVFGNDVNYDVIAYNVNTGAKAWEYTMTGSNGATPDIYDLFQMKPYFGNGLNIWEGLGGDLWAINDTTGHLAWYANTTQWQGSSGIETPYNVWPLWVFTGSCISNDVGYFAGGHEYNPPLFHGAQLYAVNMTDGSLVWSELDTSVTSTAIAYGKVVSLNAYDNQLYCFGKGPSATTVSAPNIGVTTATPITITGSVLDTSTGTQQQLVKSLYPNGLPAVSDSSQSAWMEYVYQQQVQPTNTTGVPVTISVLDSNNNFRTIGTTTTNALGNYGFQWTPDIPGNFTIVATFAGSNSYYGSSASIYLYASSPPMATATTTAQSNVATTSDLMTYIVAAAIAIIIVIAIVGVLTILMLRKRA